MARKAYARRYAQAIFEIALEKEELEQWQSDLQKMVSAIGDTTLLAALETLFLFLPMNHLRREYQSVPECLR